MLPPRGQSLRTRYRQCGIILTGGGAYLRGIAELMEQHGLTRIKLDVPA